MTEDRIEPRPYLKLLLLAAMLGLMSAVVTFAFIALVNAGIGALWEDAAAAVSLPPQLFTLLVCAPGGLLVGVLVKVFGDHTGIFAEMMVEFGQTGRFD